MHFAIHSSRVSFFGGSSGKPLLSFSSKKEFQIYNHINFSSNVTTDCINLCNLLRVICVEIVLSQFVFISSRKFSPKLESIIGNILANTMFGLTFNSYVNLRWYSICLSFRRSSVLSMFTHFSNLSNISLLISPLKTNFVNTFYVKGYQVDLFSKHLFIYVGVI